MHVQKKLSLYLSLTQAAFSTCRNEKNIWNSCISLLPLQVRRPPKPPSAAGASEESDYEEIALPTVPPTPVEAKKGNPKDICDLCGVEEALVRCRKCAGQMVFCFGCDQMYHRHPKRTAHVRQVRSAGRHRVCRVKNCCANLHADAETARRLSRNCALIVTVHLEIKKEPFSALLGGDQICTQIRVRSLHRKNSMG